MLGTAPSFYSSVTVTGPNGVVLSSAASGSAVAITATGVDTNVSIALTPKGAGAIVANGPLLETNATGLTATGTSQATALALTKAISTITSAGAGTGVLIANLGIGGRSVINNRSTNTINAYPPGSSGVLNAMAVIAPITIAANTVKEFYQATATQFYSFT